MRISIGVFRFFSREHRALRDSKGGHCLKFKTLITITSLLLPFFGYAQSASIALPNPISVSRVSLYMVVPFVESPTALNGSDVMRTGCAFTSTDAAQENALIAILRRAHMRAGPSLDRQVRRVLNLDLLNGGSTHLEIDEQFASDGHVYGSIDGRRFEADKSLGNELVDWARGVHSDGGCTQNLGAYESNS